MTANENSIPKGVRVFRDRDGHVVLDLPVTQDPLLKFLLVVFGMPFTLIGLTLLIDKGEVAGLIPFAIGSLVIWGGIYFMMGRVELRLGADSLSYTRLAFRRWKTHIVPKASIVAVEVTVSITTNSQPSSWSLRLKVRPETGRPEEDAADLKSVSLPGNFKQPTLSWLQDLLSRWATG
jgi:hypothetical protein